MKRFALVLLLGAVGCSDPPSKPNNGGNGSNNGGPTVIDPDDYDQSCEFDYDCAHVYGGVICGCGTQCPDAISADAVEQFNADRDAIECADESPEPCAVGGACAPEIPVCASGTCESIFARTISADEFDRSCETVDDCVMVSVGQICDACDCGRGAIAASALSDYEAALEDVDCNPGPSPCDCAEQEPLDCVEGMCVGGATL